MAIHERRCHSKAAPISPTGLVKRIAGKRKNRESRAPGPVRPGRGPEFAARSATGSSGYRGGRLGSSLPAKFSNQRSRQARRNPRCARRREIPQRRREKMKAHGFHFAQVAHRSIGDVAGAVQRQGDGRVNRSHQGPESRSFIDILDDHHPRLRHPRNVVPPIHALVVPADFNRGLRTPGPRRYRVSEHRAKLWKLAPHGAGSKPLVPKPHTEPFNGVGDGACIQFSEAVEIGCRKSCAGWHGYAAGKKNCRGGLLRSILLMFLFQHWLRARVNRAASAAAQASVGCAR